MGTGHGKFSNIRILNERSLCFPNGIQTLNDRKLTTYNVVVGSNLATLFCCLDSQKMWGLMMGAWESDPRVLGRYFGGLRW